MNLGDNLICGNINPKSIGTSQKKVESLIAQNVESTTVKLNGVDLSTTLTTIPSYTISAFNGSNATNKFLKATNNDGTEGEWTALNEGATIQIITSSNISAGSIQSTGTVSAPSFSGTATNATNLSGGGRNVYVIDSGGVPELQCTSGNSFPNNVHVHYSSFTGQIWPSDDRIKHDEKDITDGLNVIRKLRPKIYKRDKDVFKNDSSGERITEMGFIAQEVKDIPELSNSVKIIRDDLLGLSYFDLFTYNIAATKQLDILVQKQQGQLKLLTDRISALERS